MVGDRDCGIILCLAGSLNSAGLKQVFIDMIRSRMVDAIVSTGANIVDQDFFEGLGFHHYKGTSVEVVAEYQKDAGEAKRRYDKLQHVVDTYVSPEWTTAAIARRHPTSAALACRRS